jgi:hypothetical protein
MLIRADSANADAVWAGLRSALCLGGHAVGASAALAERRALALPPLVGGELILSLALLAPAAGDTLDPGHARIGPGSSSCLMRPLTCTMPVVFFRSLARHPTAVVLAQLSASLQEPFLSPFKSPFSGMSGRRPKRR